MLLKMIIILYFLIKKILNMKKIHKLTKFNYKILNTMIIKITRFIKINFYHLKILKKLL